MHKLRHTYVAQALAEGATYEELSEWTGDTVRVLIKTYSHLVPNREKDARRIVNAIGSRRLSTSRVTDVSRGAAL